MEVSTVGEVATEAQPSPSPAGVSEQRPGSDTLSIVLFSGTDDRLASAALLIAGAAAMDRPVTVLLQYWALDAFRADRINTEHGVSPEAGREGTDAMRRMRARPGFQHWSDLLRMAKDIGEVRIHACAQSMELFGLARENLDPLVDDVAGVAAFLAEATGAVAFI